MAKFALIFPGQGSQKIGMGQNFYNSFSIAKETFQEIDEILKQDLSQLMFTGDIAELTKTENTQPALMAVSVAITRVINENLNNKLNSKISFTAGHSLGEYSAHTIANSLKLTDTAKLLKTRGNAMSNAGKKTAGAMAAIIGVNIETAQKIADAAAKSSICAIANDNSEGQIVISGNVEAIDRAVEIGKDFGAKKVIKLPVSGAFHSKLMQEAQDQLAKEILKTDFYIPEIPIITNVNASATTNPEELKTLLIKQVTKQVRWRETILKLKEQKITDIIEIGSGAVLTGLSKRIAPEIKSHNISEPEALEEILKLLDN
jgi:[acyl-carrier-protein] S-malonyltransferase